MDPHTPHGTPGAKHPAPPDPEHDIDAKSTTLWVVGWGIGFFVCMWLLLLVFHRVQETERARKIDSETPTEYATLKQSETGFLNGDNPGKKTIDQVLRDMVRK